MRLVGAFAALLFIGAVDAQQAQFTTKFENVVTPYIKPNTGKAIDIVGEDVYSCDKTMDDIMKSLMDKIMGLLPSSKYLSGLSMLTNFQSCLGKAGSSMDKAMATVGAAFKSKLTPLFNKVKTKVCTMKTNGKAKAACLTEGYKLATAALTKPLVQQIIYACMKASTAAEYACAASPMQTIMASAGYDMTFNKAKG